MAKLHESTSSASASFDPEKSDYDDTYVLTETTPTYIRHGFVRKVFAILFAQLLVTLGFSLICYFYRESVHSFISKNIWIFPTLAILSFITSLILIFSPSLSRRYPLNYAILVIETLYFSFIVGLSCAFTKSPTAIVLSVSITLGIILLVVLFTLQTKIDFTRYIIYFILFSFVTLVFGFIGIFVPFDTPLRMFYYGLGVLGYSLWMVLDLQLIIGGKTYEWTVDDYVPASLSLYTDVIGIFLNVHGSAVFMMRNICDTILENSRNDGHIPFKVDAISRGTRMD